MLHRLTLVPSSAPPDETRERAAMALELIKYFDRIGDESLRIAILDLVRSVANEERR